MARCIWVCKAYSPRDGGWVRSFGSFPTETDAWNLIVAMWDMIVRHGDYETIKVVRTVAFR